MAATEQDIPSYLRERLIIYYGRVLNMLLDERSIDAGLWREDKTLAIGKYPQLKGLYLEGEPTIIPRIQNGCLVGINIITSWPFRDLGGGKFPSIAITMDQDGSAEFTEWWDPLMGSKVTPYKDRVITPKRPIEEKDLSQVKSIIDHIMVIYNVTLDLIRNV